MPINFYFWERKSCTKRK